MGLQRICMLLTSIFLASAYKGMWRVRSLAVSSSHRQRIVSARGGSRHSAKGLHHVADPDIRLGGNLIFVQYLTFISLLEGGPKSIAKLDRGAWPDLPTLDLPLVSVHIITELANRHRNLEPNI